ncbi:hypothetical protein [Glycomyces tenuis]|uniref:hypothetical protein n=1 Tax=Glycomyces tenuis TaxID=58116 RepID=UPI00054E6317|nr:hypothetical protein [Glycomyces tenuis]
MTTYGFLFLDQIRLQDVAAAVASEFGVPADRIELLSRGRAQSRAVGLPVVLIEHDPDRDGEHVSFSAGDEFASAVGDLPEVGVAARLCAALKVRAILGVPNAASDAIWTLVAADGSSGMVLVDTGDLDDARYTITGKLQEIKGAPEIPLVELSADYNPFYT